jgi:endoglucanase
LFTGNVYLILNTSNLGDYEKLSFDLIKRGLGVHCGECGAYNKTPNHVFLSWFEDVLDVLHQNGIGFGIWEFSVAFGILNSGRQDVAYQDWYGQKLDRKYLTLLMKYT